MDLETPPPSSDVRELFREIQDALGIPWVPAPFQVYGTNPPLLALFWSRLAPVASTQGFLESAMMLLKEGGREVARWEMEPFALPRRTQDRGALAKTLDALLFGNAQLMLVQTVLSGLLREEAVGRQAEGDAGLSRPQPGPFRRHPLATLNPEEAPEESKRLLADIRQGLGLKALPVDYTVLARWPEFLGPLWRAIQASRAHDEYFELCGRLTWLAEGAVAQLSPAASLDTREVRVLLGDDPEAFAQLVRQVEILTAMCPATLVNDLLGRQATHPKDFRGERPDLTMSW
jgi:hypothetical protein